jgi:hypothetical protein
MKLQIRKHSRSTWAVIDGSQILSAMSSKLASIGVVLAAYELGRRDPKVVVGVAHVESQGYRIDEAAGPAPVPKLFTMWLTGECYAE